MTERFELLSQLGKGGMGVVWKARDTESGEIIALKLLHSIYVDDADYVARFEREVEVSQRIVSPNVVRVLGYGKRDGVPYVAMEYVDGKSLREVVHERGPLPWEEAKPILRQIAEGLGAAHAAGVIHRDVKPSNIMIDSAGVVKLADFGIARAMDLTRMTGGVTMLGTPAYMSPDMETTEQSDLYGLGCVLFELLTGVPPFVADSQQQVLMKHIRDVPQLEKLPPGARKITGWLLEKDPRRRPPSAAALLGVLDGSSKITRSGVGVSSRWKPVLIVGGPGIVALAGIVGLAAMFWGVGSPNEPNVPAAVETAAAIPTSMPTLVSGNATTPKPLVTANETVEPPTSPTETAVTTPTATSTKIPAVATAVPVPPAPTTIPPAPTSAPTKTATPIPTPTPLPAAPVIQSASVAPLAAKLGGSSQVSLLFHDANGDAVSIEFSQVSTQGTATWFGSGRQSWPLARGQSNFQVPFPCTTFPYTSVFDVVVVDSTGARSNAVTVALSCG